MSYITQNDIDLAMAEVNKDWILDKLKKYGKSYIIGSSDSWWELDGFFRFYDIHNGDYGYSSAALTKLIFGK